MTGTSSTSSAGLSVVTVELEYGADLSDVRRDLEQAVAGLSGLPEGAQPQVAAGSTEDLPVAQLAATSPRPAPELAQLLDERVVPRLAEIEGVRDVALTGDRPEQLVVDLDTAALAAQGLSPAAVVDALQAAGAGVPAGAVGGTGERLPVQVGSPLNTIADLRDLAVPTPGGSTVRLGDIATVTSEPPTATGFTRSDGSASIGIGITKETDASSVDVSEQVRELLPELEEQLGEGAALTVAFDQAPFIEKSVEDLTVEGALGLGFAVLVILVFLMSVRSTLVTAVSIPLSVLLALISLYVGGFSLNILTLGALTVAVGRVVDDSIVVIENIKRHLGRGESRRTAILGAVREVAGAVTASTLTTVAVFLPIAFVGGPVGELFRPFALTVTAALVASLLVSLTIVPVLASWFMSRGGTASAREDGAPAPVLRAEGEGARLQQGYLPVLRGALSRPVVTLGVAAGILAGTVALVPQLETNFLDASGQNTVVISQELPPGTGLAATDEVARRVEEVLAGTPEVQTYQVTVGQPSDAGGFGPPGGSNTATFFVTTDPEADQEALQEELRADLAALPDAGTITVGAGGGNDGLAVVVQADDDTALAEATAAVERAVRDTPGTADVASTLSGDETTVAVTVDRVAAAGAGVTEGQIGQAVAVALRGIPAGSVVLDDGAQDLVVRTGAAPADVAELRALPLPGGTTLDDVAAVEEVQVPATITRIDGERSATVTARPAADDLGQVTSDLRERLDDLALPAGATAEIGGVSADQEEAFADLGLALVLAIAIVYLVMVATFRSLLQPLILLVSIPFAATGALGLLLLTGIPLGVASMIGMLMLVGIVVTNAIVLIDLVNQYRARGASVHDAVVEGARLRLRPILMTALATILALTPMAFGVTGGSVFISQPLAVVVIGGLISSTLLTLVLVPVLYSLADRAGSRSRRRRADGQPTSTDSSDGHRAEPDPHDPALTVADLVERRSQEPVVPARTAAVSATTLSTEVHPAGSGPTLIDVLAQAPPPQPVEAAEHTQSSSTRPGVAVTGPAVVGNVRRGDGAPLAGAVLALTTAAGEQVGRAITAKDGSYVIPADAAGFHLLICRAGDRPPAVVHVDLGAEPTVQDVTLSGPAALAGVVVAPNSSGPAPAEASAILVDGSGDVVATAATGPDGRFRFPDLTAGTYVLTAETAGRVPAADAVQVPAAGEVSHDLVLGGTGRLVGRVRSAVSGRVVPDAVARVLDAAGREVAAVWTDEAGEFAVDHLAAGRYTVSVVGPQPVTSVAVVDEGTETRADLDLAAAR